MFRQIVKDNQCVHAVIHKPLAHGRSREWRQILIRGRIGSWRSNDDRIRHRAGPFEHIDEPGNTGLLLADRNVNAVQGPIVLIAGALSRFVQTRLINDGVDTDGRLTRRTVTDDQFALAASNRNHCVDRHDARLHRLLDRPPLDDARREFLDGICDLTVDGAFAVNRLPQSVDDTSEEAFANRYLQQLARSAHVVSFPELRVVAQNYDADFILIEVQRKARDAVAEIDHLVEHRVGEAFDSSNAVSDLADDAYILFGCRFPRSSNFSFNFRQKVSHIRFPCLPIHQDRRLY